MRSDLDTTLPDKQLQAHYIYIDNRPISLTRNPAKHLFRLIRESYPSTSDLQHSFVLLNLHCDRSKIKYDCNIDPAKIEIIFERFEHVSDLFMRFLRTVGGLTSTRPTTGGQVNFFSTAVTETHLPSPPPSSPIKAPQNVYAIDQTQLPSRNNQLQQNNKSQRSLDEFRSRFIPVANGSMKPYEPTSVSQNLVENAQIRSLMGRNTDGAAMDLTEGIVSSRHPRQMTKPERCDRQLEAFPNTSTDSRPIGPPCQEQIIGIPRDSRVSSRPQLNMPKTNTPRGPRDRKSRNPKSPNIGIPQGLELGGRPFAPLHGSQTLASEGPMFSGLNNVASGWNPWTIAAINRPKKRAKTEHNDPQQISQIDPMPMTNECVAFTEHCYPDTDLHTLLKSVHISLVEIAFGQRHLLSHVPPPCDLMDFLLDYCT